MSEQVVKLPIGKLKEHPNNKIFRNLDSDELGELAGSIEIVGLMHSVVVTQNGDTYTIISGHQRTRAMKALGWDEVPCVVREFEDEFAAEEALIDSNVQTRSLSPIEMARSIRRKKQLIGNRQGARTDLMSADDTSRQNVAKLEGKTAEEIAKDYGMTSRTVERFDSLNNLILPLEKMMEEGNLSASVAFQFATLKPEEQQSVFEEISGYAKKVTMAEAKRIKAEVRAEVNEELENARQSATRGNELAAQRAEQLRLAQLQLSELRAEFDVYKTQKPKTVRSPEDVEAIKAYERRIGEYEGYVKDLERELDTRIDEDSKRFVATVERLLKDAQLVEPEQLSDGGKAMYNDAMAKLRKYVLSVNKQPFPTANLERAEDAAQA